MARASRPGRRHGARGPRRTGPPEPGPQPLAGSVGRARLAFLGAIVASAIVLFAWFPAGSLLSQRSNLSGTEAELGALHQQDAALAQEKQEPQRCRRDRTHRP